MYLVLILVMVRIEAVSGNRTPLACPKAWLAQRQPFLHSKVPTNNVWLIWAETSDAQPLCYNRRCWLRCIEGYRTCRCSGVQWGCVRSCIGSQHILVGLSFRRHQILLLYYIHLTIFTIGSCPWLGASYYSSRPIRQTRCLFKLERTT